MVFMVQTRAELMSAATSERSKTTIRGFSLKRLMRPSSAHRKSVLGWTPICLAIDFALENFRRLEASVRSETALDFCVHGVGDDVEDIVMQKSRAMARYNLLHETDPLYRVTTADSYL